MKETSYGYCMTTENCTSDCNSLTADFGIIKEMNLISRKINCIMKAMNHMNYIFTGVDSKNFSDEEPTDKEVISAMLKEQFDMLDKIEIDLNNLYDTLLR